MNLYMKRLLKKYSCNDDMELYELIVNCFENGQITQCDDIFYELSNMYKKQFLELTHPSRNWNISEETKKTLFFRFLKEI